MHLNKGYPREKTFMSQKWAIIACIYLEVKICKIEMKILPDECLGYVRRFYFFHWSNYNNFETVDGSPNVLNI